MVKKVKVVLAIMLVLAGCLVVTAAVTAQTGPEQDKIDCTEYTEIYQAGRLIASCDIVNGQVIVNDGNVIRVRTPTAVELKSIANAACNRGLIAARNVLSTPRAKGDIEELDTRQAAIETILAGC